MFKSSRSLERCMYEYRVELGHLLIFNVSRVVLGSPAENLDDNPQSLFHSSSASASCEPILCDSGIWMSSAMMDFKTLLGSDNPHPCNPRGLLVVRALKR